MIHCGIVYEKADSNPGIEAVPGDRVALGYVRSIEGVQTGHVYRMTETAAAWLGLTLRLTPAAWRQYGQLRSNLL
jgi:hypothetical protein